MVPEYEERESARFAGLTWVEWRGAQPEDRADGVAHHRAHMLAEAHAEKAVSDHMKAQGSRK